MRDFGQWLVRGLPCVLLVLASALLGARLGRILPERLELPTLILAVLAVAGFYLAREAPVWNWVLLMLLAAVLGTYGTLANVFDRGAWSWVVLLVGISLAAMVGLILRPRRGMRVVFSLAVAYVMTWFLVSAVTATPGQIRYLAVIGWFLFVGVGSYIFARAAEDGQSVEVSGLMGDLLVVSANLMLTGVTAFGH